MANIANTDWSWAALLADLDNDGWKDLTVTNGFRRDSRNADIRKKIKAEFDEKGADYTEEKPVNSIKIPSGLYFSMINDDSDEEDGVLSSYVVQEINDGKVEVSAVDPIASMQAIQNADLEDIANQVQIKLKKVIDSL